MTHHRRMWLLNQEGFCIFSSMTQIIKWLRAGIGCLARESLLIGIGANERHIVSFELGVVKNK